MRLYRTAKGRFVGTKDDARADGRGWKQVEVPTNKAGLLAFLNDNIRPPQASPAFVLGRSDAERGITTNPYSSPDLRAEWERGHAHAFELGLAPLPSFAVRVRGVSRFDTKKKKRRKAA